MGSLRVLHLVGSPVSPEFDELSRLYARGCLAAVESLEGYDHIVLHIGQGGGWRFPHGLSDDILAEASRCSPADAIMRVSELDVDVMVPHLFCPAGMTHYRALFDVLGIPYVGNPPAAMALTARKDHARAIVAAAGIRVPDAEVLRAGDRPTLAPPVVVKPVDGDNSAGVSLVRDAAEYGPALDAAQQYGAPALVERFIAPGREVRCGLIERDGELVGLPLEEYPVDPDRRPVRTAADKLGRDGVGQLELVAKGADRAWIVDIDDPATERVWAAARRCHMALGCRHYSLFDFRIDPDGEPWFLEAGLYCSFSPQSVLATMAAAAGLPTAEFFDRMVTEALRSSNPTLEVSARARH
jgi:D-alanine-D-alanine ligase